MKYPVFAYRDNKVAFMTPFIDQNDESAIRGFSYAINSEKGVMNFAPSDYDLYKLGEFDTDTGKLIPLDVVELVISGSSVVGVKEK